MVISMLEDRLREARKNAKLTQEALANLIGVKRSVISKYENGTIEPSLSQLKKIAAALDVPVAQLEGYATDSEEKMYRALLSLDSSALSKVMNLPEDSVQLSSPENATASIGEYVYQLFHSPAGDDLFVHKLMQLFFRLNNAGKQKAIERLEELAEVPKYQRTEDKQKEE